MIDRLRSWMSGRRPDLLAVLDIGTVEAKALIVLVEERQASVVGVGRAAHAAGAVAKGSIRDAQAVTRTCEQALVEAENMTDTVFGDHLIADKAVLGIGGPMLHCVCLPFATRRPQPKEKISQSELRALIQRTQRLAIQQAAAEIADKMGAEVEVGLVCAQVCNVRVDGYVVGNAVGMRGERLEVCISNVVAPLSYLAVAGAVAISLDMELLSIGAGVCAVAQGLACAPRQHPAVRGDAVIVDVGGECTDVLLVRNGGIEALHTLPVGGATLTRRVGQVLSIPAHTAEEAKRSYGAGPIERQHHETLRAALLPDLRAWANDLETALRAMGGEEALPSNLLLCGGGVLLPDLEAVVKTHPWPHVLVFKRQLQVTVLEPRLVSTVVDRANMAVDASSVVPLALASAAARTGAGQRAAHDATTPAQLMLDQAVRGMGLL